jgi:hypothetical protein
MMRSSIAVALAFAGVLVHVDAVAGDDRRVEDLLRLGVQLRRARRDEEALDAFSRALALSPTPIARAQVALAEQALGRWVEAERDLDAALASAEDIWIVKNRSALDEARAYVIGHLGWLTVSVEVANAAIRLDGRAIEAESEERVASGAAVLSVAARGYVPDIRHIEIAPAQHVRVQIELLPLLAQAESHPAVAELSAPSAVTVASPALATSERASPSPRFPTGPATLLAAGLTSIGVGVYFGVRAIGEKDQRDALCSEGGCTPAAFSYDGDARASSLASTATIGAGAAATVGAAVWWLVDGARHARDSRLHERSVAPFVLGVLGLAGAGAGTYLGLVALHDDQEHDAQCAHACSPAALSYAAEAGAAADLATAAFAGGAALLGGAAILWIADPASHARVRGGLQGPRLAVGPQGVLVQGAFE